MKRTLQKKSRKLLLVLIAGLFIHAAPVYSQLLDPNTQPKFVNPLPIPGQIDVTAGGTLEMEMNETTQWLGLVDPVANAPLMTKVWGYGPLGGPVSFPGPTFIAKSNVPVNIKWHNNLPATGHFLPVDVSLHMAHPHGMSAADYFAAGNVPAVVHLHGGKTESASDGLPEAWYSQGFVDKGPQFIKETYTYHNTQEAATLWYHDHALGITRLNVYAGLAGFYLLEDKRERDLVKDGILPKGPHDIEIVIQDRMFDQNGQLFLPSKSGDPWFGDPGEPLELPFEPSVVAEFFGDFIVVNGVTWPFLEVEPRPYRFRLLNGSDSRFYVLEMDNKMPFMQIGTDNGLLPNPVPLTRLIIAPGERAEVVVDFSNYQNQNITVLNFGPDEPFKGANFQTPNVNTGQIMQFQVTKKLKANGGLPIASVSPSTTLRPPLEDLGLANATRKLALFEGMDADGRLQPLLGVINGDNAKTETTINGSLAWFEPITENPGVGDVEIWEVYNATEDAHPIHLHLVSFQILDRTPFDAVVNTQPQVQHDGRDGGFAGYIVESTISETGPAEAPAANELGWKDTFIVPPGYFGRVKAKFERPGRYVWHCHILSHEDHEMMRPFHVGPMPATAGLKSAKVKDDSSEDMMKAELSGLPSFKLYPNPVTDLAMIEYRLENASSVNINIYDLKGSIVYSEDLGSMPKGYYSHRVNTENIEKGVYIFELRTSEDTYRERILIAR